MSSTLVVELALICAMLLAVGCLTGFLAGLLGIGAGAPVLLALHEFFLTLGVPEAEVMHLSAGTGLAVMVPTSLRSFARHRATGKVDMDVWRAIASGVVLGSVAGILVASRVDSDVMRAVFVVFGTLLAIRLVVGLEGTKIGDRMPGVGVLWPFGAGVGLVSTLMGTGGGAFVAGLMTLYGRPIHQAVATGSGAGPLIAVPATIGFIWAGLGRDLGVPGALGYVHLPGAAIIATTSVLLAPYGVRAAHGVSRRTLELVFAAFLAFVCLRFVVALAA
ncbi:MAG: TSUP family transporter [Rhizobiales bacterium]|nr:TSUP family transporter [Hyphomicrobiales bacterium]